MLKVGDPEFVFLKIFVFSVYLYKFSFLKQFCSLVLVSYSCIFILLNTITKIDSYKKKKTK